MPHILALDQGTTSSRAIVFDPEGRPVATQQREYEQHYPRPGWVEHDPEAIWTTQRDVAEAAVAEAGLAARDVAAIGITNQRETTIVWDRATGAPIHRAIVWQDRRTAGAIDALVLAGAAEDVRRRTGLVPDAYFSATKIAWILDAVDGARERAERGELAFGTVDAWLVHRLTGGAVHATDVSNASRTMLVNLETVDWDDALLERFRVPRAILPEIRPSCGDFGAVRGGALDGVAIAGVIGDQQAALFGQHCVEPGASKSTYGTGCFLLMNTGGEAVRSDNRLLTTIAWGKDGAIEYALEGSVFIGGALVQWLRDGLGIIDAAAEVEALAASVDDSGGVVLVPAFAGLGAPHWDQYARGTMFGLTRGTTRAHVARAGLEAIALQVADLVDAMHDDAHLDLPELRVDGGAAANALLMQLQADVLGAPIARPRITETTALGAAYLAGLAAGTWRNDDLAALNPIERRFEPSPDRDHVAELRGRWREAVERSKGWVAPEASP